MCRWSITSYMGFVVGGAADNRPCAKRSPSGPSGNRVTAGRVAASPADEAAHVHSPIGGQGMASSGAPLLPAVRGWAGVVGAAARR